MFPRPVPARLIGGLDLCPGSTDETVFSGEPHATPGPKAEAVREMRQAPFSPGLYCRLDRIFSFLPCRHVLPIFLTQPLCGRNAASDYPEPRRLRLPLYSGFRGEFLLRDFFAPRRFALLKPRFRVLLCRPNWNLILENFLETLQTLSRGARPGPSSSSEANSGTLGKRLLPPPAVLKVLMQKWSCALSSSPCRPLCPVSNAVKSPSGRGAFGNRLACLLSCS